MKKSLSIFCIILITFSTLNFCLNYSLNSLETTKNFQINENNSIIPGSDVKPIISDVPELQENNEESFIKDMEKHNFNNFATDQKDPSLDNNSKNSLIFNSDSPSELLSNIERYEKLKSQNVSDTEIEDIIKKEKSNKEKLPKRVVPSQAALDSAANIINAYGNYKTFNKMWYYRRPFDRHSVFFTNYRREQKRINLPQKMKELQVTVQFNAGITFYKKNPYGRPQGLVSTLYLDNIIMDQQKFFYYRGWPDNSHSTYQYFILRGSMFNVSQGLHDIRLELKSLMYGFNVRVGLQLNYYGAKAEISLVGYPDLDK